VENLIKPVVYDAFWRLISQNDRKSIKKALGFSVKVADVLRLRKTMKNHWLQAVSQLTKKVIKIPYKTCRFRSLFWSLTQKGSRKPL
jgi:hypothetical protein